MSTKKLGGVIPPPPPLPTMGAPNQLIRQADDCQRKLESCLLQYMIFLKLPATACIVAA